MRPGDVALRAMRAFILTTTAALAASGAASAACVRAEHGQFDFWVGRWEVSPTGQDRVVARSLIEKLYDGYVIRENWAPLKGPAGGSLSGYDPVRKAWRQTWADGSGGWADFQGGRDGPAMVLTGAWPTGDDKARTVRMTYSQLPDGAVRQRGEESLDGGKTWTPSFDFTYRRAAE